MKIRAERKALAETVTWVCQAIAKNPSMPALAGLRLTAVDGHLVLRGFDYDVSHQARLEVEVLDEGDCLVSGVFVRNLVAALKGQTIDLVLERDRLTLTCGQSTYSTSTLRLDDYPTLPAQPETVGTVDAGDLAAAVATCRPPVEDASDYKQLRGMHLEGSAEALVLVGLRAQVGIEATLDWSCTTPFEATAAVKLLEPAAKGMAGEVQVGHSGGVLGLADETHSVTIRTFADKYVLWRDALRSADRDVFESVVDVDDLIEVVKRAGALADEVTPLVLTFDEGEVQVQIAAGERGGGQEVIPAENTGAGSLAMHPRFLLEALGAMPPGPVRLGVGLTQGRLQAVIARPHGTTGRVSMVMPKKMPGGTQ